MYFVLKGAANGLLSSTDAPRTVDDSKTSTLNLWTSEKISTFFESQKMSVMSALAVAGALTRPNCANNTWRNFYFETFKPEHQSLFTADKINFICPRAGVYEITLNIVENVKTNSMLINVQTTGINNTVMLTHPIRSTFAKNPNTSSVYLDLTLGQQVKFVYSNICSQFHFVTFLIRELL
jgi:hypothetical protein